MTLKSIVMAGAATVALSAAMITPAPAAVPDDFQAEETRALNLQALEDAQRQNGSLPSSTDAEDDADGQGGPSFDGPPEPDDMGTEDLPAEGEVDETDDPDDTLPPDSVE
jgi:hypothetical protein